MMFSRIGRSISRLSRSRNVLSGENGGRSLTLTNPSVYQSRYIRQADDKLVVLKRYLGSLTAKNQRNGSGLSSKVYTSDINYVLRNPGARRFFYSLQKKDETELIPEQKRSLKPLVWVLLLLLGMMLLYQLSYISLCREVDNLQITLEKLEEMARARIEGKMEAKEEKEE